MIRTNKLLIRAILISSYLLLCAILVFLISGILSYLNTGADRSTLLHTQIHKETVYTPQLSWQDNGNEGRPISQQVLNEVENNYLDAWYIKQVAYRENKKTGIEDFYTKNARKNLYASINNNAKNNTYIAATTLSHQPDILFYSEDGQLIVLEDKAVVEHKKVFQNKKQVLETTEQSDYKHILLLEDGFWRIRHSVKESTTPFIKKIKDTPADSLQIKGINYYPQDTPWDMFGDDFDAQIIANDFELIKKTGLNTIRIFVPYEDFGKANLKEDKLEKLQQVLDIALKKQLKVVVTLFDFYGNYDVLDWTLTYKHARGIVTKFKDHNAILAWDLKNEPNLDFASRGKENVVSWLDYLLVLIKSIDETHPVTIGWSNVESATILSDKVDYVSFHYYEDVEQFETQFLALKKHIPNKPLILQEFGLSSYGGFWRPFASSETTQAEYHKTIQQVLTKHNIHFMSWTLYDFKEVPSSVVGKLPWRTNPQKKFGFIDADGKKKASFEFICE
ncbi:glycosyl hydrolase family 5 [Polaribacter sp. WD7]|uniref:glycoside hydrolase family 2 TIM barrel-domain containing protein n=1 Tax=Polaribacter sp. WD7 TaxID=2269061 RepID=UPI000DF124C7|nr:glycoside hydrolase family 2 TIM barrel-domain containing protein [Polaribacter sp. WD7]RCS27249.1 glycosyl hydrolase family 5 [Polaribacter sp. WD7]